MTQKKFCILTLGCKLNYSESSTLERTFENYGYAATREYRNADICVINTCSVTEHAEKKCRNIIRKIHRANPAAIIAVTGCYAQLRPEAISAIEGVDIVIGNDTKGELFEKVTAMAGKTSAGIHGCNTAELTGFFGAFSTGERTRSFLKIQDGCSYRCSYCTIPMARGESRSLDAEAILANARAIALSGRREIVLTGINTGDYGRGGGTTFYDLLRQLEQVEGIDRYRISSIEPNLLTDQVIGLSAAGGKFQPHFHIPLQSGSDRILGLMRRRYTTDKFRQVVDHIRDAIPDAFIGIDVIVGFPGETEEDFAATCDFLEAVKPAFLHVFPFSERPGTPAAGFSGKVAPNVASARAALLGKMSDRLHHEFLLRSIGASADVLFESSARDGRMTGYTGNYIKVSAPLDRAMINTIRKVRLGKILPGGTVACDVTN